MRIRVILIAVLGLCVPGSGQKPKKPADVTIVEVKAHRAEGKILVDGRVRVTAVKPLRGLVVIFDLMSPENGVMATEKATVGDDVLEPGQEGAIHAETSDPVRAVRFRIRASDAADRELRVENTGPFPIE